MKKLSGYIHLFIYCSPRCRRLSDYCRLSSVQVLGTEAEMSGMRSWLKTQSGIEIALGTWEGLPR